jgi:hypothetical protein
LLFGVLVLVLSENTLKLNNLIVLLNQSIFEAASISLQLKQFGLEGMMLADKGIFFLLCAHDIVVVHSEFFLELLYILTQLFDIIFHEGLQLLVLRTICDLELLLLNLIVHIASDFQDPSILLFVLTLQ